MTHSITLLPALALPLAVVAALPALSSSEAAWEEFRTTVETECTKLVETPDGATSKVEVNPFGSESYGVAMVTLTLEDGTADLMACVYDKQEKTAELTAPFATEE